MLADPFTTFGEDDIWEDEVAPEPLRVVPSSGQVAYIPTWYHSKRYRSRLEVRWAIFFDECAIPYRHEEQPYGVDGEGFLPDFRLTDRGIDVEVKRDDFIVDEATGRQFQSYVDGTRRGLVVVRGWPERAKADTDGWYGLLYQPADLAMPAVFAECRDCHRVGVLAYDGGACDRDLWIATSLCRCRVSPVVLCGPTINQAIAVLISYDFEASR